MEIKSTQKITPFLWFDNNAGAAMDFYCSIFKDSKIISKSPGPNGEIFSSTFQIGGLTLFVLNGGPMFKFNESISLFVSCDNQEEVDFYWNKLIADGGKESRCGWLKDKYGLSWQIIPTALSELMGDPNREKSQKVMMAMLSMNKIIIADLKAAYEQD